MFILCSALATTHSVFSQLNSADSSLYFNTAVTNTYRFYIASIKGSAQLYNGAEYVGVYPSVHGNPFFESTEFDTGFIYYDHILYNNIPLKYDLVSNEVVTKGFQKENISLVKEKIESFYVMKHLFVHIIPDSSNASLPDGFYDLLYQGHYLQFLVKREKLVHHSLHAEDPSTFLESSSYYIKKGNDYYTIENKKTLAGLFADQAVAMKKFWQNKKVDFKKNIETAIKTSAEYYDHLKK